MMQPIVECGVWKCRNFTIIGAKGYCNAERIKIDEETAKCLTFEAKTTKESQ